MTPLDSDTSSLSASTLMVATTVPIVVALAPSVTSSPLQAMVAMQHQLMAIGLHPCAFFVCIANHSLLVLTRTTLAQATLCCPLRKRLPILATHAMLIAQATLDDRYANKFVTLSSMIIYPKLGQALSVLNDHPQVQPATLPLIIAHSMKFLHRSSLSHLIINTNQHLA